MATSLLHFSLNIFLDKSHFERSQQSQKAQYKYYLLYTKVNDVNMKQESVLEIERRPVCIQVDSRLRILLNWHSDIFRERTFVVLYLNCRTVDNCRCI